MTQIPLGVLLKNENVIDDMVHILDALHKYVPTTTSNKTVQICEESEAIRALDIDIHHFRHILLGGDQLTVARIRGTQCALSNSENGSERLEGFIPVIEDPPPPPPPLSAAMTVAEVQDLQGLSRVILSSEDHLTTLTSAAKKVCSQFCNIAYCTRARSSTKSTDRVQEYAMETLSLGLLLLEFKDAVREGDGTRVIRCWKYFLIIFRVTGHKNYCLEALHLLTQYYFTLPPQYAEQMVWGRFVPQAILRTSKALGVVKDILCQFDGTTGVCFTGKHTRRSDDEDLTKVLDELFQCQVFSYKCGRAHNLFPSMVCNKLLTSMNKTKFQKWMTKNVSAILKQSTLSR